MAAGVTPERLGQGAGRIPDLDDTGRPIPPYDTECAVAIGSRIRHDRARSIGHDGEAFRRRARARRRWRGKAELDGLRPVIAVKTAVLDGFGDVFGNDRVRSAEVGDR